MILSGETGYGTEFGKWVFKVSYGKLSGTSTMLILVVYFFNGGKSDYFDIYQGVAQGCTLSSTLFLIFIDGLMKKIERTVPSLPSLMACYLRMILLA